MRSNLSLRPLAMRYLVAGAGLSIALLDPVMGICQVEVEPSAAPVYYQGGSVARYFVRPGNGTRELDVPEAIVLVARHRTGAGLTIPDSS